MSVTAHPFRKAVTVSATSTSYTAKVPTTTKPSGTGVFNLFDRDLGIAIDTYIPKYLLLVPFGSDANDETFDMRLWGWSKTLEATPLWVPQLIADLNCTLGNIAATALGTNHFLCDTIVIDKGSAEKTFLDPTSPADDTTGSVLAFLRGVELIEFDFDLTGGAGANCLWRPLDEC